MFTYSAFPHATILSAILRHSIDVNKVVMGSNSQEVTVYKHKELRVSRTISSKLDNEKNMENMKADEAR